MGKATAALRDFIESIPDAKLTGFRDPRPAYMVYSTRDFRLDVRNVSGASLSIHSLILPTLFWKTSTKPPKYNLQVQINRQSTISTLKAMKDKTGDTSTTMAKALVPTDGSWSAATIPATLLANRKV